MLKNYYEINEESTVENFLKEIDEKKNSRYIILDDEKSYINFRDIALNVKNSTAKLKTVKRPLSMCEDSNCLSHLIESGELVIKTNDGLYDLEDAYKQIIENNYEFLNKEISKVDTRAEVFAINEDDKISSAKAIFKDKKNNLLPVLDGLKIVGELRPFDLLAKELFSDSDTEKKTFHNDKIDSVLNMPVANITNKKPLTVEKSSTIKDAIEKLIDKKIPSIMVTQDNNNDIYSIFSYKDIFKLVREEEQKDLYNLEIIGTKHLYPDEQELVEIYARKTMGKIIKLSDYDSLKISFKTIGNTIGTHMRKFDIKLLLSHGNHILTVEKQINSSVTEEELHSHEKETWNVPKITQQALSSLEKLVKNEHQK